jgi:hypothetical protein
MRRIFFIIFLLLVLGLASQAMANTLTGKAEWGSGTVRVTIEENLRKQIDTIELHTVYVPPGNRHPKPMHGLVVQFSEAPHGPVRIELFSKGKKVKLTDTKFEHNGGGMTAATASLTPWDHAKVSFGVDTETGTMDSNGVIGPNEIRHRLTNDALINLDAARRQSEAEKRKSMFGE